MTVATDTRLVLRVTRNTVLKRRIAPAVELGFRDAVATSPNLIPLKTFYENVPGEDLTNHLKLELLSPCHGTTTWYIERQTCIVERHPVNLVIPTPAVKPAPAPRPVLPAPPAPPAPSGSATTRINAVGLKLIKEFEGLRLEAYICPAGVPTIGYGSTAGVKMGDRITEQQADALLLKDLERFEKGVRDAVKVPLTSNQFSALVSFAFNLGVGALQKSTLLQLLNKRDYKGAADQLLRWNKANGRVLEGLRRRREAERKLFLTP